MDYLSHCLNSIKKSAGNLNIEIVVVDNNSTDASPKALINVFPEVNFILLDENLGFGKANNIGVNATTGEYILILNPDTVLEENTLQVMYDFMESRKDVGIAGCKVLNSDGTFQLACRRGFPTPWVSFTKLFGLQTLFPKIKLFSRYNQTYKPVNETYEVDSVIGAFMFIRRNTWDKINGFDEAFFMYGEDIDLCYRAKKLGDKVMYVHSTSIIHYKGISTKRSTIDVLQHFYDAMTIFSKKHFAYSGVFLFFLRMGIAFRKLLAMLSRHKRSIFVFIFDLLAINLSLMLATKIRFDGFLNFPDYAYPTVFIVISLVLTGSMVAVGEYFEEKNTPRRAVLALLISFFFLSSLTYFFKEYAFSRGVVLMTIGFSIVLSVFIRVLLTFYDNIKGKNAEKRIAIIGTDADAQRLYAAFAVSDIIASNVIGFISVGQNEPDSEIKNKILGNYRYLHNIIKENGINEIIITDKTMPASAFISLIEKHSGSHVRFHIASKIDEFISSKIINDIAGDEPDIPELKIFMFKNRILKRAFDIFVSLFLLTLGIPFVYLFSGEPKKRIKELFSVLSGSATIVGIYPSNTDILEYKRGITGLAHISSPERLSEITIAKLNEYYINNYSFLLDIEIILKHLIRKKSGR
jgi:GT2 family glycosyltransferase